ncbi:SH3 domain-containing protein [Polaribacter sp. M15]
MKNFLFLLLMVANTALAQNTNELFAKANDLYKNDKLEEAVEIYEQVVSQGLVSSELYYNLGNSYYKLNKVGPSIYYYEKALKLNPLNADAANNLIFAKRLALDNIEELPKTVFQKINQSVLQKLSYNQWAIIVVIFSFLGSFLFLLYYFANTPSKKRFYFVVSTLSFILLLFAFGITYQQYSFAKNNKEAIVFAEETEVRNAPTLNSDEVFTLHEGTKVIVLDTIDDWKKIKIADGKLGWIIASEIRLIDTF